MHVKIGDLHVNSDARKNIDEQQKKNEKNKTTKFEEYENEKH